MIKKKKKQKPQKIMMALYYTNMTTKNQWHIYPLLRGQTFAMDVSY